MAESSDSPKVPSPEAKDSPEVVRCLEAAREMWELSQLKEAVRWVQRGAEAAEQDGNDMRALSLARAGADLSAHARSLAEPAASQPEAAARSVPTPPRPRVSQPPDLPAEESFSIDVDTTSSDAPSNETRAPAEADKPNEDASKPPVAAAEKAAVEKAPAGDKPATEKAPAGDKAPVDKAVAVEKAPAEKAAAGDKPTADKPAAFPAPTSTRSLPTTPSRPPSTSAAERASVRPAPQAPVASRSQSPSMSPKPAASSSAATPAPAGSSMAAIGGVPISELIASGRAERVSVKRSALDAGVLVVRAAGGKASQGARQAVLVYTDGDEAG